MSKWSLDDVVIARSSIVACVACAPKKVPRKEVNELVNALNPTGIDSRWAITRKRKFPGGWPHPCPCDDHRGRVHYLLYC